MKIEPREAGVLTCELRCSSSSDPLEQIYTGFKLLHEQGLLRVRIKFERGYSGNIHGANVLEATVEVPALQKGSSLRLVFDVDDECLAPDDLRGADYYFSRSFNPRVLSSHPQRHRIPNRRADFQRAARHRAHDLRPMPAPIHTRVYIRRIVHVLDDDRIKPSARQYRGLRRRAARDGRNAFPTARRAGECADMDHTDERTRWKNWLSFGCHDL